MMIVTSPTPGYKNGDVIMLNGVSFVVTLPKPRRKRAG